MGGVRKVDVWAEMAYSAVTGWLTAACHEPEIRKKKSISDPVRGVVWRQERGSRDRGCGNSASLQSMFSAQCLLASVVPSAAEHHAREKVVWFPASR